MLFPAGTRCFGGNCSPVRYYCDGVTDNPTNLAPPGPSSSLYATYDDSLCVGGVVSSTWPASTCPNNRCYRTNAAWEAGQAGACALSTTATATATASSTASLTRAATKTATATASASIAAPAVAAPVFSLPNTPYLDGPTALTISSSTPGAFLYVSFAFNPNYHFQDALWIEDSVGLRGPSLTLTVPFFGGGILIRAHAGRGDLGNSSEVNVAYYFSFASYSNYSSCSGVSRLPRALKGHVPKIPACIRHLCSVRG